MDVLGITFVRHIKLRFVTMRQRPLVGALARLELPPILCQESLHRLNGPLDIGRAQKAPRRRPIW